MIVYSAGITGNGYAVPFWNLPSGMNKLLKCQCLKLWVLFQDAVQVIYYKFSSVFHDATASSFHLCTVPTHHTHMPVVHFQMDNVFSRQSLPLIHDMQTEEICLSLLLVISN